MRRPFRQGAGRRANKKGFQPQGHRGRINADCMTMVTQHADEDLLGRPRRENLARRVTASLDSSINFFYGSSCAAEPLSLPSPSKVVKRFTNLSTSTRNNWQDKIAWEIVTPVKIREKLCCVFHQFDSGSVLCTSDKNHTELLASRWTRPAASRGRCDCPVTAVW